jgi:hypothetical protein
VAAFCGFIGGDVGNNTTLNGAKLVLQGLSIILAIKYAFI